MRYVCPANGELVYCPSCKKQAPHLREEQVKRGEPPVCETHNVKLVKA